MTPRRSTVVGVYRFLLTPRWWAINVFVVAAVPFCLVMGSWQMARFEDRVESHQSHEEQRAAAETAEPRPLDELVPVGTDTVGEQAELVGEYDVAQEVLVPERDLDGERGFYVLTPLLPANGGAAVPVVRGWLPGPADPAAAPEPPAGEVTVVGALQAAESPRSVNPPAGLPPGQIGVIGAASLINVLPYEVTDHWITVREAAEPMAAVPAEVPSNTGLDIKAFQNLGYTAEWFVFAAFAVFMWFRLFRRELETQRDAELGLLPAPEGGEGRPSPADGPERASPAGGAEPPAGATEPSAPAAAGGSPARTGSPAPPA